MSRAKTRFHIKNGKIIWHKTFPSFEETREGKKQQKRIVESLTDTVMMSMNPKYKRRTNA